MEKGHYFLVEADAGSSHSMILHDAIQLGCPGLQVLLSLG